MFASEQLATDLLLLLFILLVKFTVIANKLLLFLPNCLYSIYFCFHLPFRTTLTGRIGRPHMFLQMQVLASCKMFLKFSLSSEFFFFFFLIWLSIFKSLRRRPFGICAFSIIIFLLDDNAWLACFKINLDFSLKTRN